LRQERRRDHRGATPCDQRWIGALSTSGELWSKSSTVISQKMLLALPDM
jgi:hypothetical protein